MNDCHMSWGSKKVCRTCALPGASQKTATSAASTTIVLAVEMAVARRPPPVNSRGPRPVVPGRTAYVYYLPPGAKQPIVIDDQIARPNGLTLTRDGKTLIVDDTLNPTVYAYDVEPDGSVKNKRTFAQLRDIPEGKESGADGMALDREDRVYITTVTGVQVFDAAGKYLGTIKVPRQPANVGFAGPDKRMLYITAREGLYRLDMLAQGPDRIGK